MDVQRTETDVKPDHAVGPKKGLLADLILPFSVIAVALAGAVVLGVLSTTSAISLGLVMAAVLAAASFFQKARAISPIGTAPPSDDTKRLVRFAAVLDALPQPVMVLDAEDRIEVANQACYRSFGDSVEGQHIAGMVRAPQALSVLREARHDGEAREAEITLSAAPQPSSALFYVAPLDVGDGQAGNMIVMVRDRTEQKQLERMRTDFIANASHELRTPLAAILGFIETLQGHAKDDPDARERFLGIMQAQTERMLRLVKDLVSLSALELNERRVPEEQVDLCEVTATVREMMAPVAQAANGEVVPGPRDCNAYISGDRDQLIQVVQNLVDNALKYGGGDQGQGSAKVHVSVGQGPSLAFEDSDRSGDSPEQIAVRAGCQADDLLYLRVRDEGDGIEKTDLPRLTERFYRIDVERSRSKGGTGLGLAIVKHIVGRHRGGILVESSEGEGAAFTCYFPPRLATSALPGETD